MRNYLVLLFVLIGIVGKGQMSSKYLTNVYKQNINFLDHKLTFQSIAEGDAVKIVSTKYYYWYSANAIKVTQGGFSGKLLNGIYLDQYNNGNLKEEGVFSMGLKDGEWNTWEEDGNLISKNNFTKGVLSGIFYSYKHGELVEKGTYKDGVLHGLHRKYIAKDSVVLTKYRMGKAVPHGRGLEWVRHLFNFKK